MHLTFQSIFTQISFFLTEILRACRAKGKSQNNSMESPRFHTELCLQTLCLIFKRLTWTHGKRIRIKKKKKDTAADAHTPTSTHTTSKNGKRTPKLLWPSYIPINTDYALLKLLFLLWTQNASCERKWYCWVCTL